MAKRKLKRTRLELKHQRDGLERFQRFLPLLKLKQQQLQIAINALNVQRRKARAAVEEARRVVDAYRPVLSDTAGVNVRGLSQPEKVRTSTVNIAGVAAPVYTDVAFPRADYSLFATPPWVDRALADLRRLSRCRAEMDVLDQQHRIIRRELTRIVQRVNLFEKVKIPQCLHNIRVIRIHLGDQQTAAVVRAKIAKKKLAATGRAAGAPGREASP